jgi:hypothetical protein
VAKLEGLEGVLYPGFEICNLGLDCSTSSPLIRVNPGSIFGWGLKIWGLIFIFGGL